jgi:LPXTG-motif cell wall-anchored protein
VQTARASLPQTGSVMPVAALVGGLAWLAAIALWFGRRHQA